MKIKIGTRGSKLALWQADHVAGLLKSAGAEPEIVPIETKGDQILECIYCQNREQRGIHGRDRSAVGKRGN